MRFAALLGVMFLLGCGNPKREVHDVAQKFSDALRTQDRALAEAQLTRAARDKGMVGILMPPSKPETKDLPAVGEAVVEGDTARIPITIKATDHATLLLRKEDSQWRVWGVQASSSEATLGSMTLNLEKPEESIRDYTRSAGEAIGSALKGFSEGLQKGLSDTPALK